MIGSSRAWIGYVLAMTGGYVFAGFYPKAPYTIFAVQLTLGFIAYITKRIVQKRKEYNGKN